MNHFDPLPQNAKFSVGTLTLVKPLEWGKYLEETLCNRYPQYYRWLAQNPEADSRRTDHGCVLNSIERYLLDQFGVVVPKNNLFSVYNFDGQGIFPGDMVEAIAAVIEPLGFEIELILAADEELRLGLGEDQRIVGLERGDAFDGRAGICMINICSGYSHAFYWKKMEPAKFLKDQFRMAVLIKRRPGGLPVEMSALDSLDQYCRILSEYATWRFAGISGLQSLQSEINALMSYTCRSHTNSRRFRKNIALRLESILKLLGEIWQTGGETRENSDDLWMKEAGSLTRAIFTEREDAPDLSAGLKVF